VIWGRGGGGKYFLTFKKGGEIRIAGKQSKGKLASGGKKPGWRGGAGKKWWERRSINTSWGR